MRVFQNCMVILVYCSCSNILLSILSLCASVIFYYDSSYVSVYHSYRYYFIQFLKQKCLLRGVTPKIGLFVEIKKEVKYNVVTGRLIVYYQSIILYMILLFIAHMCNSISIVIILFSTCHAVKYPQYVFLKKVFYIQNL